MSEYLQDLFAIATDQPFRFPSTFTFVMRAFSTLEGAPISLFVSLTSLALIKRQFSNMIRILFPMIINI